MLKLQLIALVACVGLVFQGCDESDATNDSINNNFTILEGSVPGTLIEAFCVDGSYYHVTSVDNGTSEHPFALEIPKDLQCHLVMTTNENNATTRVVSPIRIATPDAQSSLFYAVANRVDFNYIPLQMDRNSIIDSTGDGVLDTPFDVSVGSGLVAVRLDDENSTDPLDSDKDGIINIYEDDDDDGTYNKEDDDDDGDGINDDDDDEYQDDRDKDGIKDSDDSDDDNDGIKDDDDHDDEKKEDKDDDDEDDDKDDDDDKKESDNDDDHDDKDDD